MRFIAGFAQYENCLAYLGSGLLYFCRSLAHTAADPELRAQAIMLGRWGFSCWKAETGALPAALDAAYVAEYVRAYGAAEALGVRSPRVKARLRQAARMFRAVDYLGFDPKAEAPPADMPATCDCGIWNARGKRVCADRHCGARLARMTRYRTWSLAVTSAYCGERYGVPLGAHYRHAMRWLPLMRPYPPASHREFHDAAYAVTHVVYTLNDYGACLLSPYWLPWEYEFLRRHIETAVARNDADMAGEFLDTLRAFSIGDDDEQVRRGYDFLLDTQNSDGSWGNWDWQSVYVAFHTTWAAIDGLREFAWSGPGLAFPELLPSLNRWARVHY
jgi:hypothetical protein